MGNVGLHSEEKLWKVCVNSLQKALSAHSLCQACTTC